MEKKKNYTPPTLTAVEFRSERGFATSGVVENITYIVGTEELNLLIWSQGGVDQVVYGYNTGNDKGLAAGYFNQGDPSGWFQE